jgi:hypothetical protein
MGFVDDSYTTSLLHFDYSIVDQNSGVTWTAVNNATISSVQYKFGKSSINMVGGSSHDALTSPKNSAFEVGSGDFTIDWWSYRTSSADYQGTFAYWASNSYGINIGVYVSGHNQAFLSSTGSSWDLLSHANMGSVTLNTWEHWAMVRNNTTIYLFKNGTITTQQSIGSASVWVNSSSNARMGSWSSDSGYAGYIDEFRFSKGIARWTSNFTPPTSAYGQSAINISSDTSRPVINAFATTIYGSTSRNIYNTITVNNATERKVNATYSPVAQTYRYTYNTRTINNATKRYIYNAKTVNNATERLVSNTTVSTIASGLFRKVNATYSPLSLTYRTAIVTANIKSDTSRPVVNTEVSVVNSGMLRKVNISDTIKSNNLRKLNVTASEQSNTSRPVSRTAITTIYGVTSRNINVSDIANSNSIRKAIINTSFNSSSYRRVGVSNTVYSGSSRNVLKRGRAARGTYGLMLTLIQTLLQNTNITNNIGTTLDGVKAIYPVHITAVQNPVYPCITLTRVSGGTDKYNIATDVSFQIDVWGKGNSGTPGYTEVAVLYEEIRKTIEFIPQLIQPQYDYFLTTASNNGIYIAMCKEIMVDDGLYEPDTRTYHLVSRFRIWTKL